MIGKKKKEIFCLLTSLFLLLAIGSQSIHQIHHFHFDNHFEEIAHDFDSCTHNGHFTSINHCKFCDFNLAHSTELVFEKIEASVHLAFSYKCVISAYQSPYSSIVNFTKPLRGPPILA